MSTEPVTQPTTPRWVKHAFYWLVRFPLGLFFCLFYGARFFGSDRVPRTGALVVVANHQSHLDPPLIGIAVRNRPLNFLARKTLFRFGLFAWLIGMLDAIPLDQSGIGYAGIKESLRRLKHGEALLIFPEGARTWDGTIGEFKAGFITLALRTQATILPVAIAGGFEAWARTQRYPKLCGSTIRIAFGTPLTYSDYQTMSEDAIAAEVESQVRSLHHDLTTPRPWDA